MSRGKEYNGQGAAMTRALSGHMDDWDDLAVDYLDGQLDGETRAAIELHLHECPACALRLSTQRQMLAMLKETPLENPPSELEDRILGEFSFSPAPATRASTRPRSEEPSRWWSMWQRKIRPWVPATVGVVAVLIAVVTYGLLGSGANDSPRDADTTIAASALEETANDSDAQEAAPRFCSADTMAAATATTAAATETTIAPLVGAAGAGSTEPIYAPITTTTAKAGDGVTQDEETMVASLEAAATPAYFVFEGTGLDGQSSAESASDFVDQIALLTGMEPLDSTLSVDGPTFAAYLPREDATQLVDLLSSIGASLGLTLSLVMQPPDEAAGTIALLMERKTHFPVLSARHAAKATDSDRSFSTSPVEPEGEQMITGAGQGTPDEAGTHVLIVIYVKN
jgi:hypothetical protein